MMCVAQDVQHTKQHIFWHYALSLDCVDAQQQDKKDIVSILRKALIISILKLMKKKLSLQLREHYGSFNFNYIFD